MIKLGLDQVDAPTILCLGAHCDDIEIGCGGTLLELSGKYPKAVLHSVVFSSNREREAETREAHAEIGSGFSNLSMDVHRFRNGYFPSESAEIKDAFESLKNSIQPDIVFTHFREDRHQDHRLVSDLTWNTFRDHLVLEYEVAKYDGDLGRPTAYVEISENNAHQKVDCLVRCFETQQRRPWFKADNFMALMRLRSIECNAESGFAEAFHARKLNLSVR
jgi:LmbE family N-acetylglucosaminyl deacetylase